MIKREDLKVGDKVIVIYHEGPGSPGTAYEVEIEKITKERISVKGKKGLRMDFTNDDKMCHTALINNNYQHCNLFLGDPKEAKKADDERVKNWELFMEAYDLFNGYGSALPSSDLRKIIHIIKKSIPNNE